MKLEIGYLDAVKNQGYLGTTVTATLYELTWNQPDKLPLSLTCPSIIKPDCLLPRGRLSNWLYWTKFRCMVGAHPKAGILSLLLYVRVPISLRAPIGGVVWWGGD